MAIASIETWSKISASKYQRDNESYSSEFLDKTSYNNAHSRREHHYVDSVHVLLDAMETAIAHQAKIHTPWWIKNRDRLCFSHEGALRYFGVLACIAFPQSNANVIGRILSSKKLLESNLSYELGNLIQAAFIYLSSSEQDAVLSNILTIHDEPDLENEHSSWIIRSRVELICAVPCHLCSYQAQALLDEYKKTSGILIRQPQILSSGGMVGAPFSFEVFLACDNRGVLKLLKHYAGHSEWHSIDFLTGGEREVGGQLREATSRNPTRFMHLLQAHWIGISECFRDDIMDGAANYLAHRYGNLQPNATWTPIEEPESSTLSQLVLDELERHPDYWNHNRAASNALQACAAVIEDTQEAERLVFLSIGFANLRERSSITGDRVDLVTTGINMVRGHVVEALMILANHFQEKNIKFPELLTPTVGRFARDGDPALCALILRRLPYLQHKNAELGWELFHLALQGDTTGLWETAERCLYYAYQNSFEKVAPLLGRLHNEGDGKDLRTWGRISALAALTRQIDFASFLDELERVDSAESWHGAATVWAHPENIHLDRSKCFEGIKAGLNAGSANAIAVRQQLRTLFHSSSARPVSVPIDLIKQCFSVHEGDSENNRYDIYGFDEWLNAMSQRDPDQALAAAEIYLEHAKQVRSYLYDHNNNLTQLLSCLFAEAEEREESDQGEMLRHVVALQDTMLSLGVEGVNEWLKSAERP